MHMFESGSGLMDIGRGFYVEQMPDGYALLRLCKGCARTLYRGPSVQDVLAEYRLILDREMEKEK